MLSPLSEWAGKRCRGWNRSTNAPSAYDPPPRPRRPSVGAATSNGPLIEEAAELKPSRGTTTRDDTGQDVADEGDGPTAPPAVVPPDPPQGRITLEQARVRRSQIRTVPSSDPDTSSPLPPLSASPSTTARAVTGREWPLSSATADEADAVAPAPLIPRMVCPSLEPDRLGGGASSKFRCLLPVPGPTLTSVALSAVSLKAWTSRSTQYTTPSSPPA